MFQEGIVLFQVYLSKHPQLVMTCVPNNKGDVYHAIKKLCYIESPCPSQVMTISVLRKNEQRLGPIALKVVAQMAAKLWVKFLDYYYQALFVAVKKLL